MEYLLLLAGTIIIIGVDIRNILRSRQRLKAALVYFSIIIFWSLISVLLLMERAPLSPAEVIKLIVEGIMGWIK